MLEILPIMIRNNYKGVQQLLVISLIIFICFFYSNVNAQEHFADKCVGKWEGIMYIYGKGQLRDSVPVELIVQKTTIPETWIWKTSYLSKTTPMEKNYKLVLKDASTQTYITDEGDGVELWDYCLNNKLYSVFETHDVMLTSSYELQGDQLIFEVTSGKKIEEKKEVTNYSVLNLQRVVFKKVY
jgi:hypothetical protein